ncbi:hypothetical protein BC936DRAFT_146499 [Jimgerdemannia flammicorona]|uniref:Uncharacterized protein n=2 Tax=Jimgerdemannia flammicorona TaxID=994334 RepID=A0A433QTZ4_9FUNG|nr:hypothetical protein BC936DRAFT_146499 [Jimgerdemannia flammicorona]RUS33260.1 hypothetical protein BC938DRAFT_472332 [Jimgerdemannia flammicorona]
MRLNAQLHREETLIRGHRKQSVMLTDAELLEIRGMHTEPPALRTFEGAYWRTALASFSTGLLVLKIFTREFYRIGITFFVFGAAMLAIAVWRRHTAGDVFNLNAPFKTGGNWVLLTTVVTLATYIFLWTLLWDLEGK